MTRFMALWLAPLALLLIGGVCGSPRFGPSMTGDPIDPTTGLPFELVPGTPRIAAGPDGALGTADDIVGPEIGDVDIVVRSTTGYVGAIPPPAPLRAGGAVPVVTAGRVGAGSGVPFSVALTDGIAPFGPPLAPGYFAEHPVLILAYADLDGDGFVGVTHLDGDVWDGDLEEAELVPVARRYAFGAMGAAELYVQAAGPPGAELDIVLAAVTWAGPRRPSFFSGAVPDGPAVMTRLPFLPLTGVLDTLGPNPGAASESSLVGAEVRFAFEPDPAHPAIGESFTLKLDGSQPSTDLARIASGPFERFGMAVVPELATFNDMESRPLRPGFGDAGERVTYEILRHFAVRDDGAASEATLRVVPLDAYGNIAALPSSQTVELVASGSIEIRSPDTDGDPSRETLSIADQRGIDVVIDDRGGAFDDSGAGRLILTSSDALHLLDISVPDPDVDDSGLVDFDDLLLIAGAEGARYGDSDYQSRFDLDGSGRIDDEDLAEATVYQGQTLPVP